MIYLYDINLKVINSIYQLNEGYIIDELPLLYTFEGVADSKYRDRLIKASYFSIKDDLGNWQLFKLDNIDTDVEVSETRFTGISKFLDDLRGYSVIPERTLNNANLQSLGVLLQTYLPWTLKIADTSATVKTFSTYYESPLSVVKKALDLWNFEVETSITLGVDGSLVNSEFNLRTKRGMRTYERYEPGSGILTLKEYEDRTDIYTAVHGRGKGEELTDSQGNPTGGYGRRITFDSVVWTKPTNPVNKPAGQNYVEIPELTTKYGYQGKPRFYVHTNEEITDPQKLLEDSYMVLLNMSRPKVQYEVEVERSRMHLTGDYVYIKHPSINLFYETRVIKRIIDVNNFKRTKNIMGDVFSNLMLDSIKANERAIEKAKEDITEIRDTWIESYLKAKEGVFLSGTTYNYTLGADNPYGLADGFYSFNAPVDKNPTEVLIIRKGQLGIGYRPTGNGPWQIRTFGTGKGFSANEIVTGILQGGRVVFNLENGTLVISDKNNKPILDFNGDNLTLSITDGQVTTKMLPNGIFVEAEGILKTVIDKTGLRASYANIDIIDSPQLTRKFGDANQIYNLYVNDVALGTGDGTSEANAASSFISAYRKLTKFANYTRATFNVIFIGKVWIEKINFGGIAGSHTFNFSAKYKDSIFIGSISFRNLTGRITIDGSNFQYMKRAESDSNIGLVYALDANIFMQNCKIIATGTSGGITVTDRSFVFAENCDIYGSDYGITVSRGAKAVLKNCVGSVRKHSGICYNSGSLTAMDFAPAIVEEVGEVVGSIKALTRKGSNVTVVANIPMYMTAAEAQSGTNPVAQFDPGDYFVFNEAYGMLNITKTQGVPGGWVDPNYMTNSSTSGSTTVEKPLVEVNAARTSATVNGDIKGYGTAQDAIDGTNQVNQWTAGTYAIYNEAYGMLNITKNPGSPGIWINPNGKITTTVPGGTNNPPTPAGGEFGYATRMVEFLRSKVGMSGAPAWNWLFGYWVEWCATFVSWAGYQMGYTSKGWKKDGWVPNWAAAASTTGTTWRKFYGYNERPKPGDIFIYSSEGHIGFVGWVPDTGNIFYSIEGNGSSSQYVTKQERSITGGSIGFYIRPNYQMFEGK